MGVCRSENMETVGTIPGLPFTNFFLHGNHAILVRHDAIFIKHPYYMKIFASDASRHPEWTSPTRGTNFQQIAGAGSLDLGLARSPSALVTYHTPSQKRHRILLRCFALSISVMRKRNTKGRISSRPW